MSESGIVYVIDDDPSMCDLIESTLKHAGLAVKSFSSAEAFGKVDLCADAGGRATCILLDLEMPGLSGLEFLEQRFKGHMPCPVIIISARGSVKAAVKSMKLGAVDFLEKPFAPEALKSVVLEAIGKHQNCGGASMEKEAVRGRIARLSARERELLDAIVQGNSTKMIASRLKISARTVDHHRANLMDKMQATNVADLVRMAVQAEYHGTGGTSGGGSNPEGRKESAA